MLHSTQPILARCGPRMRRHDLLPDLAERLQNQVEGAFIAAFGQCHSGRRATRSGFFLKMSDNGSIVSLKTTGLVNFAMMAACIHEAGSEPAP